MKYIKLETGNLLNGDGNRVVLWVAGCIHHCKNCHNPETWNPNHGDEFNQDVFDQLTKYLSDKYISGLTISGGDPLYDANYESVVDIAKKVKHLFPNKDIWIWTGYTINELIEQKKTEIFLYIDYLIDGRYDMNKPTTKKYRGSDNQKRYKFVNGKPILVD